MTAVIRPTRSIRRRGLGAPGSHVDTNVRFAPRGRVRATAMPPGARSHPAFSMNRLGHGGTDTPFLPRRDAPPDPYLWCRRSCAVISLDCDHHRPTVCQPCREVQEEPPLRLERPGGIRVARDVTAPVLGPLQRVDLRRALKLLAQGFPSSLGRRPAPKRCLVDRWPSGSGSVAWSAKARSSSVIVPCSLRGKASEPSNMPRRVDLRAAMRGRITRGGARWRSRSADQEEPRAGLPDHA